MVWKGIEQVSFRGVPAGVVALGFVSLCMDLSSEMIHSLLPIFMVSALGASALSVGMIEGLAEASTAITKVFSGAISDWIGRRKPLLLLGYGLAALTKPLFPLAANLDAVLAARVIDRIGKGIRGAPRDALIADLTDPGQRGAAYGLRQSMDTIGAFGGPALAMALMVLTGGAFRIVFWVAVIPAIACIGVILLAVHEPAARPRSARAPIRVAEVTRLGRGYWEVVVFAALLTLSRFSEAFLLLRAENAGLSRDLVPLTLVVMNAVYTLSSYPLGLLADRRDRRRLLAVGIGLLIAADLVLAIPGGIAVALFGAALWGLQMGATQGVMSAMVANAAVAELRGSAFGVFNLVSGVALLGGSAIAGLLWTEVGPTATFLGGAIFAALSLASFLAIGAKSASEPTRSRAGNQGSGAGGA